MGGRVGAVEGGGAGGGGGTVVVVVSGGGAVVVVVSTGTVVVGAGSTSGVGNSFGGIGRSTAGSGPTGHSRAARAGATTSRVAASARPSVRCTPARPKTPTATARLIALACRGQPRQGALPLRYFPRFTLSPMPQIHRLPVRGWRADGDLWATSALPELDLSPERKLPRSARDRLALYENGLRDNGAARSRTTPGWVGSSGSAARRAGPG